MTYTKSFPIDFDPIAAAKAVVQTGNARFTLLTPRLLRLEFSPSRTFEDRPSQAFWYRCQDVPAFSQRERNGRLQLETDYLRLEYEGGGFSPHTLAITLKESGQKWTFDQADPLNLQGTARTLDEVDGAIVLQEGLVSRSGWALYDDSKNLVFEKDGWLAVRPGEDGYLDLYFFGYGRDYAACLRDFSLIAGPAPLLPRWALGNWWSRYYRYSAEQLLGLMDSFQAHEVPLAVCIVDMDWHITDTANSSSGWTGYTWNRDLFPDPPAFIAALQERDLKSALNIHPADGVHPHEEQYAAMAERLAVDAASQTPIPFDIADPEFTRAYFELLHHPQEENGIDFWWTDWQQGTLSKLPGLDPLWWLNHLHFYDLARGGEKRPFIFSRWGGLGNHRYPIGFSGDTHVTWGSLAFQPFFTATAANVNYGWWSHDIGGHMSGIEDRELYTRWVQFGVFSPIFRLHSTANPFHERRPWGYDAEVERVTSKAMRLRHALIPYLYTMSWRNQQDATPLVRPLYHEYANQEVAYLFPDQYFFGSELLVAPFLEPLDPDTRMSRQVAWLPPGDWFDFFKGTRFPGDGVQPVYGGLGDIPVFAKAGAVVPLAAETGWGGVDNPQSLDIHLFPNGDGAFDLYEDDGSSSHSITPIKHRWSNKKWDIEVGAVSGRQDHLPEKRAYSLLLRGTKSALTIKAAVNGQTVAAVTKYDEANLVFRIGSVEMSPDDVLTVTAVPVEGSILADRDYRMAVAQEMVKQFRMESWSKQRLAKRLPDLLADPFDLLDFEFAFTPTQKRVFVELLSGAGYHRAHHPGQGDEGIILWNNGQNDSARFHLVVRDLGGKPYRKSGVIPRFAKLTIGQKILDFYSSDEADRGWLTIDEWFKGLAINGEHVIPAELDAVIQFELHGRDGISGFISLKEGRVTVRKGQHQQPNATISAEAADWLALINGEAALEEVFLAGKLQVSGDLNLVIPLAGMLKVSPAGKYLADGWRLEFEYPAGIRFNLS